MPFHDVVGQTRAIGFLQRALATGRIAHAYLFSGPAGVGNCAAALAFAQALNCEEAAQPPTPNPQPPESPHALRLTPHDACGACRSCRNIAAGQHPDVQVIEPDGAFIKIEQIRTLEADAALVPYEAPWKVFILDSAERMTEQAANALLKTLEEPAKDTVFILLTSAVAALLPTIVSRCQSVTFTPLPHGEIETVLRRQGMEPSQARLIASLSRGSIDRALSPEVASLPATRDRLLEGIGRGLGEGPAALVELAEKLAKDRDTLQQQLEILSAWLRDLMVVKASGHTRWLVNDDRGEAIAGQAKSISLNAVLDGLRAVHAAMENITRNANPRLSMEDLLLRLRELLPSTLLSVSV
ncbi:MAG: DNA polymerase III subunit delta' [Candidatus Methylomirabilota bacterium]|nr:MAG: DNA polymerase III subunit delta' [candidate division NC10 bacterium]